MPGHLIIVCLNFFQCIFLKWILSKFYLYIQSFQWIFFFCFIMQIEARRQTVLFDLLQKLKINNYLSASPHVVLLLGEPSHQLQYAIQPKPYEYNCSMWMFPPLKSLPWLLPAHMMVGYFHILVLKHKAAPVENLGTGW